MSEARAAVLARIRAALGEEEPGAAAGTERARPAAGPVVAADPGAPVARFAERVADYRAHVEVVDGDDASVQQAVAAALARHGARDVAVPDGFPRAWMPGDVHAHPATAATREDVLALDRLDGAVTTCAAAIAETGTIVLDGGAGQGPRAASLMPDVLVCVVEGNSVVATVAEAVAVMQRSVADGRPLTLISGPSATSDIELDRVEGVHGPRNLEVVVRAVPGRPAT